MKLHSHARRARSSPPRFPSPAATPALAGGPLANCSSGVAFRWGRRVPASTSRGTPTRVTLGPLTNAEAVAAVDGRVHGMGARRHLDRQLPAGRPAPRRRGPSTTSSRTSMRRARTASPPSSSTTPARSSTCSSVPAPASSGSPAPSGATPATCTITEGLPSSTGPRSTTSPWPGRDGPRVRPLHEPGPHRGQRPDLPRRDDDRTDARSTPSAPTRRPRDRSRRCTRSTSARGRHAVAPQGRHRHRLHALSGADLRRRPRARIAGHDLRLRTAPRGSPAST